MSLLEFGVGSQQTIEIGMTGIPPQGKRADGRSGVQIMEPGIFVRDAGKRDSGGFEGQRREGEGFAKRAPKALENPSRPRGRFFGLPWLVTASLSDWLGDALDQCVGRALSSLDVLHSLRFSPGLDVQGRSLVRTVESIPRPRFIDGAGLPRILRGIGFHLAAWSSRLRFHLVLDEHRVFLGNLVLLRSSVLFGSFDRRLGLTDSVPDDQSRTRRSGLVGGL